MDKACYWKCKGAGNILLGPQSPAITFNVFFRAAWNNNYMQRDKTHEIMNFPGVYDVSFWV